MFLNLLHREWQNHYNHFYLNLGSLLLYLILLPLALKKIFPTNLHLEDLVMIPVIAILIIFFMTPIQFAFNLRQEWKNKDLWLHNPAPFWQLIIAKITYYVFVAITLIALIAINLLIILRFAQNTSVIDFIPIIFGTALIILYDLLAFIIFILIAVVLAAFLKRYIGRFAYLLSFIFIVILFWLQLAIEESSFANKYLYNGLNIIDYIPLPKLYEALLYKELKELFYLKDIFINSIIYIAILYFIIKWLERVIKR